MSLQIRAHTLTDINQTVSQENSFCHMQQDMSLT